MDGYVMLPPMKVPSQNSEFIASLAISHHSSKTNLVGMDKEELEVFFTALGEKKVPRCASFSMAVQKRGRIIY